MANIFENPNSPLLKGEAHSEKEAELLDKKEEIMLVQEQIKGALKEVETAEFRLKSAKDNLDNLRKRDDELSEEIAKLEEEGPIKAESIQEVYDPLNDHPSKDVRKIGEEDY